MNSSAKALIQLTIKIGPKLIQMSKQKSATIHHVIPAKKAKETQLNTNNVNHCIIQIESLCKLITNQTKELKQLKESMLRIDRSRENQYFLLVPFNENDKTQKSKKKHGKKSNEHNVLDSKETAANEMVVDQSFTSLISCYEGCLNNPMVIGSDTEY